MMTPRSRWLTVNLDDVVACVTLFGLAIAFYTALFLRVPILTEARDFLFHEGWGARLWHVVIPSGSDYRPFSWAFFGWQRRMFGLGSQAINLVQFGLLGLCSLAGYLHLRQLELKPVVAFSASALWLFSFAAMHAAFWQATQHDKLAFLFTILALSVALYALRLNRPALIPFFALALTLLVAIAVSTKPVAFMLSGGLIVQAALFAPARTAAGYRRAAALIGIPVAYAVVHAVAYAHRMDPAWRAHATDGDVLANVLIYLRLVTNLDFDGRVWPAVMLFAPVGIGWVSALVRFGMARRQSVESPSIAMGNRYNAVQLYFCAIFLGSMALLIRAENPVAFYMLVPVYAFTGSLAVMKASLARPTIRRQLTINLAISAVGAGLLAASWSNVTGDGRLAQWRRLSVGLADGYDVLRNAVDPSVVDSVAFVLPASVEGDFYFFSDGGHTVIDPLLPSFIFRDAATRRMTSTVDTVAPVPSAGELVAVWSPDLRLSSAMLAGNTVYRNAGVPSSLHMYFPGQSINFGNRGNSAVYRQSGWSWPEEQGTWTDGDEAVLALTLDRLSAGPLEVVVWAAPFVAPEHPFQAVSVFANKTRIARWTFRYGEPSAARSAMIPAELAQPGPLQLTFDVAQPRSSPPTLQNGDLRRLGIKMEKLVLREPHPSAGARAASTREPAASGRLVGPVVR